jgi:hypothetical protein
MRHHVAGGARTVADFRVSFEKQLKAPRDDV